MPLSLRLKAVPKPVLVAFAIVVAVKLGVLLAFGPALQNDTLGYETYADAILSRRTLCHRAPRAALPDAGGRRIDRRRRGEHRAGIEFYRSRAALQPAQPKIT
jgi:hypothetical protein